jgi:hypothetical protein
MQIRSYVIRSGEGKARLIVAELHRAGHHDATLTPGMGVWHVEIPHDPTKVTDVERIIHEHQPDALALIIGEPD